MQAIYNHAPETNHISTVHSVAAVLYLQFVLHVMLFRLLNTAVFCRFLISCFPDMLHRYCLVDFELVPAAPIVTGINFCFYIPHALIIIFAGVAKIFLANLPS
jgi:hypothetical protein